MARHNLALPDSFNFRNPDDWPRWKRRFEQYRVASGLSDDSSEKQVNTLLYCLGEQAEAVLTSTNTSAEDRKVYDTVITKLNGFFKVRKNVIFERARFNRRNQQQGESAEQYIIVLYELAEDCEYGALHSEMIRDRPVVGVRDITLSEQLQTNAELTLDKATKSYANVKLSISNSVFSKEQSHRASRLDNMAATEAIGDRAKPNQNDHPLPERSAHFVVKGNIHMTNALPRMPSATAAKSKVTMEICAFPRPRQIQSKQRLNPWTLHSWTP